MASNLVNQHLELGDDWLVAPTQGAQPVAWNAGGTPEPRAGGAGTRRTRRGTEAPRARQDDGWIAALGTGAAGGQPGRGPTNARAIPAWFWVLCVGVGVMIILILAAAGIAGLLKAAAERPSGPSSSHVEMRDPPSAATQRPSARPKPAQTATPPAVLQVRCPHCGALLAGRQEQANRVLVCPTCGGYFAFIAWKGQTYSGKASADGSFKIHAY